MRFSYDPSTLRFIRFLAAVGVLAALSLACMSEVDGERAATGECPAGETCSDATPTGLRFVGNTMYDQSVLQLGPVLAGGTFEVGLRSNGGEALPAFAYDVEDSGVFTASRGEGVFGPTNDAGEPLHPVDGYLTLKGAAPGRTYLRITEPATGELYDRLAIDVYEIDEVQVVLAQDAERTYLYEGCEEMVGVRLMANDGAREIRAFDQSVTIRAEGGVEEEARFWDCVLYQVPEGHAEITFEVEVTGQTLTRTLPVQSLESDGLTECPPVMRD